MEAESTGELNSEREIRRICKNAYYYKDFDVDKTKFKDHDVADPCGLMARFFPQDVFKSLHLNKDNNGLKSEEYIIEESKKISDPFYSKNFKRNKRKEQWIDVESPRFINWMVR